MPKISCTRTGCAFNECSMCNAETVSLNTDGGCGSFLSRAEANRKEVEVRLNPFSADTPVVLLIRSNVPAIAQIARETGFFFEKEPPTGLVFGLWFAAAKNRNFVWLKRVAFHEIEDATLPLRNQGFQVVNMISEEEKRSWETDKMFYDLGKAERQQQLAEVHPPRLPAVLQGGFWNGKLYGSPGKEVVYVGGVKKTLGMKQVDEIRLYQRKREEYLRKVHLLSMNYMQ